MLLKEATQQCVSETVTSQEKNVSEGTARLLHQTTISCLAAPGSKGPMLPEASFLDKSTAPTHVDATETTRGTGLRTILEEIVFWICKMIFE